LLPPLDATLTCVELPAVPNAIVYPARVFRGFLPATMGIPFLPKNHILLKRFIAAECIAPDSAISFAEINPASF
jgi:hypothetical protein